MDTAAVTPQMFIIGCLIALLLVALVARHFYQRRQTHGTNRRFGDDHSDSITEMGNRTRLDAQRKERERLMATPPDPGR
jgi:uncharacterized membrane protein YccC